MNAPAPLQAPPDSDSDSDSNSESVSVSQRLGTFAAAFDLSQVPAEVVAGAKLCILDAIGIAFASNAFDFAGRTAAGILDVAGPGEHVVIGRRERLPLRDAALLNGVLIHGLDYDDTHPGSVVHATASALPVVLAEGLKRGVSGARALAAYVLAVEAAARIGLQAGGWWQKAGFHPTGVVGVFGAALAAGYLQGQSSAELALGQGLALSMASGSMEFLDDGTWTKRLHPGWAASSGLTAASLARQGFESPRQAFEGRFGLFNTYLGGRWPGNDRDLLAGLGERWETATVAIKPYPVCHFNHACGDAVLALQAEHGFQARDVVSITARIHRNQMPVVCEPAAAKLCPQSDYDAKFSLPYFVAACLVRGHFGLRELEPSSINDSEILALCAKVSCEHDPDSAFPDYFSGQVEIQLRDGRRLERRERVNRGAAERPLSRQAIEEKFLANALLTVAPAQAEAVLAAVMRLEHAESLAPLCAALAPA